MGLSAAAHLLNLWLLPRSGTALSTQQLAEDLSISVNTVTAARNDLIAAGLLETEREGILETIRHSPKRGDVYPGWRSKKRALPDEVKELSPTAKAAYLYVAGKPGVTRNELVEVLDSTYKTVFGATKQLAPFLVAEGKNPAHYSVRQPE